MQHCVSWVLLNKIAFVCTQPDDRPKEIYLKQMEAHHQGKFMHDVEVNPSKHFLWSYCRQDNAAAVRVTKDAGLRHGSAIVKKTYNSEASSQSSAKWCFSLLYSSRETKVHDPRTLTRTHTSTLLIGFPPGIPLL